MLQKFKRNEDSMAFKSDVEIVEAGIITRVELDAKSDGAVLTLDDASRVFVDAHFIRRYIPVERLGGYYVKHLGGWEKHVSADVFHRNYTAIAADYPIREESLNTGQQQIEGYRNLDQSEIDLINQIKAHGRVTEKLLLLVRAHLAERAALADHAEKHRIDTAEPTKWLEGARTSFQLAQMALTRAVAQPTTF